MFVFNSFVAMPANKKKKGIANGNAIEMKNGNFKDRKFSAGSETENEPVVDDDDPKEVKDAFAVLYYAVLRFLSSVLLFIAFWSLIVVCLFACSFRSINCWLLACQLANEQTTNKKPCLVG